jgi:16S rRNA (guanine1207-N2)-methyltransferase
MTEPDLVATQSDPVARIILEEAGDLGKVVLVVDDADGTLATAALERGSRVLAACDDIRDEEHLPDGVTLVDLAAEPDLSEVTTVLWRLPKAVASVEDVAEVLALRCASGVHVFGGGRDKHLVPAMNDALRASFAEVSASRGQQKSRVLRASGPTATARTWPHRANNTELGLDVLAFGNVFGGTGLDRGTRLLLRALRHDQPISGQALDLGCGSGIVAAVLAGLGWDVLACDASAAAVASTRLTAEANGFSCALRRADGIPPELTGLDLVACNPPFHRGAAKDSSAAFAMVSDAGRALRPGGELWLVFNSHLPYLPVAREQVGPTRVVVRDQSYIVTCSTKR